MTGAGGSADSLRVLVADGDPIARLLVLAVLSELGHEARVASDGAEAWRMFEEWHPELVVIDVNLDVVDGLDVCRRIREVDEHHEVFVLFLTGRDHPESLHGVLDAGGDEFIAKPMTAEDLRARLLVSRRRMLQDAARRSAEKELSKARWLAGIGDATLALQHEINNPLCALLGHTELLMMEMQEKGERNEMLDVILEQAKRIAEVVRRLRQLKNPESVDYIGGSRMINLWKEHVT